MGIGRATSQDPLELANPARSQAHMGSIVERGEAHYCASSCSISCMCATSRELPRSGVVAFNPSVVPGTDIGRDRNWLQQLGWKYLMPLLVAILPGARVGLVNRRSVLAHRRRGRRSPFGPIRRRHGAVSRVASRAIRPRSCERLRWPARSSPARWTGLSRSLPIELEPHSPQGVRAEVYPQAATRQGARRQF
jgi:hypothetical protein